MITMEMLGKVKRLYSRDKKSLHEIAKSTGLSRNTIRKWVRDTGDVHKPTYRRNEMPSKLTAFAQALELALKADSHRTKQNRRTVKALFAQIKVDGYLGGYSQLTAFIRQWRGREGKAPHAFVPLKFDLGEAFQFDCSEEGLGGGRHLPSHAGLPHETVRQSGILAGGLPQSRARNAIRRPHPILRRTGWCCAARHLRLAC